MIPIVARCDKHKIVVNSPVDIKVEDAECSSCDKAYYGVLYRYFMEGVWQAQYLPVTFRNLSVNA